MKHAERTQKKADKRQRATARTNTFERQARAAAQAYARGEGDLTRLLTSSDAAAPVRAASAGHALPFGLLASLQASYHADLGVVRAHTDDAAAARADLEGARAFTSGADIFFGAGAYQPHTREGQALIAHEIAHVLQQTAVIDADGVWHATDTHGSADVQRDDITWRRLKTVFTRNNESAAAPVLDDLGRMMTELETLVGASATLTPTLGENAAIIAFEERVKTGTFDERDAMARTLLMDTLKLLGRYEGAAHLLNRDGLLKTSYPMQVFVDFIIHSATYGLNWVTPMFRVIPAIREVFPAYYLEAIWRYLTRPTQAPSGSAATTTLTRTYIDTYLNPVSAGSTFLKDNERVYLAYVTLRDLNNEIGAELSRLEANLLTAHPNPIGRRKAAAVVFQSAAEGLAAHSRSVYRDLSPQIVELTTEATRYWQNAQRLYEQLRTAAITLRAAAMNPPRPGASGSGAVPTVEVVRPPAVMLTDRRYSAFARFITAQKAAVTAVMGGETPRLLESGDYAAAIESARTRINTSQNELSSQSESTYRRNAIGDTEIFDKAQWYGFAQWFNEELLIALELYSTTTDQAFYDRYRLSDVRLQHRHTLAGFGLMIGYLTNDRVLIDAMMNVMRGVDVGHSYFAFTGTWVKDDVPSSAMAVDFPGLVGETVGSTPLWGYGLSPTQMAALFRYLFQRTWADTLQELVRQYGNQLSEESYGLIQRSLRMTRERAPMPERWRPEGYTLVWNANDAHDPDHPERENLASIVRAHPRFEELLDTGTHRQDDNVLRSDRYHQVKVWFLPSLFRLNVYLNSIPALRTLIYNELGEEVTANNIVQLLDTLERWSRAERTRRGAARARGDTVPEMSDALSDYMEILDTITDSTRDSLRTARTERDAGMTLANIHDRRVTQQLTHTLLVEYNDSNRDIRLYGSPNRVLELIQRYETDLRLNIPPDIANDPARSAAATEMNDRHMMALILSLARDLHDAFVYSLPLGYTGVVKRYDVITGFYGYVRDALQFAGTDSAADRLNTVLQAPNETAAPLLGTENLDLLRDLRERWDAAIEEVQRQFGFRTTPTRNGVMRIGSDRVLPVDQHFTIDGVTYMINTIHTDFVFHNSYGRNTPAETAPIVEVSEGGTRITPESATPLITFTQFVVDANGEEVAGDPILITSMMTPDQVVLMERLAHAVTMRLLVEGMEALQQLIQDAVMLGVEVAASLFPPANIGLTVAQFGYFLINDFPAIQRELFEDPERIVNALHEFLAQERDQLVENLWAYLLFEGTLPFEATLQARLMADGDRSAGRHAPTSPARGRMGRLMAFVRRIGARLLESFLNLKRRVVAGMISARRVVARFPLVARLLRALPALISVGSELVRMTGSGLQRLHDLLNPTPAPTPTADQDTPAPGPTAPQSTADTISEGLSNAFNDLFAGLEGMVAPEQILPMETVYAIIIDRFAASFGRRGRIASEVFKATGLDVLFGRKISEYMTEQGLDPNLLWRNYIRTRLQDMLHHAQVDMATGVNDLLHPIFADAVRMTVPSTPPTLQDDPAPALEGLIEAGEERDQTVAEFQYNPWDRRAPRVPVEGGRELSPAERARYEHGFGHDFDHVRLHEDEDAAKLTEFYHATALTSGSHIYLSERLDESSAERDRVLRHELAHVLQQTGARPLSYEHDPYPVMGTPHRGLQRNNRRELAAMQMAREALGTRDEPMTIEEAGGFGLLPTLTRALRTRVLEYMRKDQLADSFEAQVERMIRVPRAAAQMQGFYQATQNATRIWNEARAFLRRDSFSAAGAHDHTAPFNHAREAIAIWFDGHTLSAQQLRALTFFSFRERADGHAELVTRRYVTNLSNYIFGDMGINLDIQYDNSTRHVTTARVVGLELGVLDANSRMFQDMKRNTDTFRARRGNSAWTSRDWDRVRAILRGGISDSDRIWHTTEFRLANDQVDEIQEILASYGAMSVGTWANYIDTDTLTGTTGGLRVATHGQLSGATSHSTAHTPTAGLPQNMMTARGGRQSHHIPQFLLVQYFQNLNGTRLHRRINGLVRFPPGFEGPSSRLTGFDAGGSRQIDFTRLNPNAARGEGLPAVSLATVTHVKGQLHVNFASEWGNLTDADTSPIEYASSWSQGISINRTFYDFLRTRTGNRAIATDEALVRILNSDPNTYKPGVYSAIKDTYHWMYTGMRAALESALRNPELEMAAYSAALTPGTAGAGHTPNASYVNSVMNAIDQRNVRIMSQWR